jgi:ferric hydroxamate transport system permease protein
MSWRRPILIGFGFILLCWLSMQFGQSLTVGQQWSLLVSPGAAQSFAEFQFVYATLPRLVVTLLVGGCFGVVGSVMQQLTQNALTSPLTLGTSSGAWLSLLVVAIYFPNSAADYHAFAAMSGALVAFLLIIMIAGLDSITGLPVIIAGMVVNILLGAFATSIILFNQEYAQSVFMWGAGDLAQNGWEWPRWLSIRLLPLLLLVSFTPRVLAVLRLGKQGAKARGLNVVPFFFGLMLLCIWLVSASITAVGLIGFIGLITPNVARSLGARTPHQELWCSLVLGAGLLLLTDMLAMWLSYLFGQVIPSGVTAAAIGAPALIWFSRHKSQAQDALHIAMPSISKRWAHPIQISVVIALIVVIGAIIFYLPTEQGGVWGWPSAYQWQLRWPRSLAALSAGAGLAVAGVILQRLIYNPLASPELLGVSSGATFALVVSALFFPTAWLLPQWLVALLGSLVVLGIIIVLARRSHYSASNVVLIGIALSALLQALVQFCLAKGNQDSFRIVQWLAGSTYRVTASQSVVLFIVVLLLLVLSLSLARWIDLISVGRAFAKGRGLSVQFSSVVLLTVVALLCASVTSAIGPISFVGLIAPHLAVMLGARTIKRQLMTATIIGCAMMLWADWLGQVMLFPRQIAAGTLVAIIGSSYFLFLLILQKGVTRLRHGE